MRTPFPTRPPGAPLPVLLTLLLGACAVEEDPGTDSGTPGPSSGAPWFEDVADEVGVDFVHTYGDEQRWWIPEVTGSGVGLFDHDADGDLDLYVLQGCDLVDAGADGPTNRLFSNRGDGTFEDVTERAGVGHGGFGMGLCVGDYDGDGDVDLYVTNVGRDVLYRNEGDGTFTDVTDEAGLDSDLWSTGCSFLDVDGDGDLDLFVVNYIRWRAEDELECTGATGGRSYCHPNRYDAPLRDTLWRNDGDGTFTDVSEEMGLGKAFGNGLGLAWGDLNGDGHLDVYVANDGTANQLWIGNPGEPFDEQAMLSGCALSGNGKPEAGMGVILEDLDEDGSLDLFVTHLRNETNTFYRRSGRGFRDETNRTGTQTASNPYTGFGVGSHDFDHDGLRDLYVANGRVGDTSPRLSEERILAEPDQVFRGTEPGKFEEVLPRGGTASEVLTLGRGAAFGDLDGDLDVDVVVLDNDGALRVLRNVAPKRGGAAVLRVLGANGLDAVGARVDVTAGDRVRHRQVQTTYSYCATNDPRLHVGLGDAPRIERARVTWLDGTQEDFGPLDAGAEHVLRRGQGRKP